MLKISIVTLFPDLFIPHLGHLPLKRALEKDLAQIELINLRDFSIDARGTVDSPAYGGGPGMILRPEPIFDSITSTVKNGPAEVIFLTPRGNTYRQGTALELSKKEHLILICGRYEGIDQRVIDYFVRPKQHLANISGREISVGEFVLSGGEIPALVVTESVIRLIPGAIDNPEALAYESFSGGDSHKTEHPQYSKPQEWKGLTVPEVLLSGHHGNIQNWKVNN